MRTSQCQAQLYPAPDTLPSVSVVICFAEEMWSSLFRTVWSVLDRTPQQLLKEIILVNDNSVRPWLKADLDEYMKAMPSLVKLMTTPERSGLIKSRTYGAEKATGDIIVFLDSHCECSDGWCVRCGQGGAGGAILAIGQHCELVISNSNTRTKRCLRFACSRV